MVKSESELKRLTKQQLMQWLTRHDQRLPADEKLKPYYLERALKYYKLLQKENANTANVPSRSKSKSGVPSGPGRSKKKNVSKPVVRTKQRRHSTVNESSKTKRTVSRSPSRSRKKVHKIPKKKSPGKNSPGLQSALRKKRARVRRQTADPLNLSQMAGDVDAASSSDQDESDIDISQMVGPGTDKMGYNSDGDIPIAAKQPIKLQGPFPCPREPSQMTINDLQQWLDDYGIAFAIGQRKAVYVNLVRQHAIPPKRQLSPQHKDRNSPKGKKPKPYTSPIRDRNAPLPAHLRKSPLTPQDEEKRNKRMRRREGALSSNGLLSTPSLNKTGVQKINTPSKAAMRDEIRSILLADMDDEPLRPVGITPGGPQDELDQDLDHQVLDSLLTDLRQGDHEEGSNPCSPRVRVFTAKKKSNQSGRTSAMERKEDSVESNDSYYASMMSKMASAPFSSSSPASIAKEAKRTFTTNKKKNKMNTSFRANRTMPSPATPEAVMMNNGNDIKRKPPSPLNDYQQQLNMNDIAMKQPVYEEAPMSPAIQQKPVSRPQASKVEGRQRVQQVTTAPKVTDEAVKYSSTSPVVPGSPGIAPSSLMGRALNANKNLSPHRLPFETKESVPTSSKWACCRSVIKFLSLSVVVAGAAFAFHVFDGLDKATELLDSVTEMMANIGNEEAQKLMFCDLGSLDIADIQYDGECIPCPDNASFCTKGTAVCSKNYILRDNHCVLDGVLFRYAYDIRDQANRILAERRGAVECGELEHVDGFRMHRNELMARVNILDETKLEEAFAYFDEKILPDASTMMKEQGEYFSTKPIKSPLCTTKEWAIDNILGLVATFCVFCVVFAIWRRWKGKQREAKAVEEKVNEIYHILEDCHRFNKQPFIPVDVVKQRIQCRSDKVWQRVNAQIVSNKMVRKSVKFIDGMHKNCWQITNVNGNQSQSRFDGNSSEWSPGGVVRDENQKWKFGGNLDQQQKGGFRDQQEATRFPAYSKSNRNAWQ